VAHEGVARNNIHCLTPDKFPWIGRHCIGVILAHKLSNCTKVGQGSRLFQLEWMRSVFPCLFPETPVLTQIPNTTYETYIRIVRVRLVVCTECAFQFEARRCSKYK